jgi:hypothetical protein
MNTRHRHFIAAVYFTMLFLAACGGGGGGDGGGNSGGGGTNNPPARPLETYDKSTLPGKLVVGGLPVPTITSFSTYAPVKDAPCRPPPPSRMKIFGLQILTAARCYAGKCGAWNPQSLKLHTSIRQALRQRSRRYRSPVMCVCHSYRPMAAFS